MSQSLIKTVADFETILASQVTEGDTTATLSSADDTDDVVLASGNYGLTVDGDVEDSKEYIIASVVGTALTNVVSISRQGAATTGFQKFHRRGASVAVTDWASLSRITNVLDGTTDFDANTHLGYDGAPTGLTGNEFATVAYVLSVVNGGSVTFNQQVANNQTAGENLTAQDQVYFKEADAKWYKVDADLTATYQELRRGIALSTVSTNATLSVAISGPVAGFTGLSAGAKYYASNTAGAISTTPGTNTVFVGWALTTTILLLDPYGRDIPYGNEKDALAGSLGTPSSTNPYITTLNESTGGVDQSQTTQNSTTVVGMANTTGLRNKVAQSFIPTKTKIRGTALYKSADTGTFTGTVTVALQADSTGSPSGVDLASVTITNAQWLRIAAGEFYAIFSSQYNSLTLGSLYWLVISTSTSDTSNHPNLGINTAGGYANGSTKYNNTADGWIAISTIDLYFKTFEGTVSQVAYTGTDGYIGASLVPQLIGTDRTAVSIVDGASAAETTVFTRAVPAGLLGTRNIVKGKIYLSDFGLVSTSTVVFRVKYGITTIGTITIDAPANLAALMGYLTFEIVANNSASAQIASAQLVIAVAAGETAADATVGITKAMGSGNGTATEDSTVVQNITVTAQYSAANAVNDLTVLYGYLEVIRQ